MRRVKEWFWNLLICDVALIFYLLAADLIRGVWWYFRDLWEGASDETS